MKRIRFSEEQIITVFHEHEGGWKGRTGGATLYQLKAIRRGGIVPPGKWSDARRNLNESLFLVLDPDRQVITSGSPTTTTARPHLVAWLQDPHALCRPTYRATRRNNGRALVAAE